MSSKQERTDSELLYWAAGLIKREQDAGTYGTVIVVLEGGKVVRVKTERQETPVFTMPPTR